MGLQIIALLEEACLNENTEHMSDLDQRIRLAAFSHLDNLQQGPEGDLLRRSELMQGFMFEGKRVPLVSAQQGIFKPAVLPDVPLSILTAAVKEGQARPYEDSVGADGLLGYRYRGTDVQHRDNAGLRLAMQRQTPLIYFLGIVPGQYVAAYPVFIVGDRPETLTFTVSVDEHRFAAMGTILDSPEVAIRRRYVTREVLQRAHQREFRERVLDAYRRACAICRLKRQELLDAAHIIGDREESGLPEVSNGIALCKLHHSAYDANIIGIRSDLTIHVREDVLKEVDGPMLVHGLQGWNGRQLAFVPPGSRRPDPERLAARYDRFLDYRP